MSLISDPDRLHGLHRQLHGRPGARLEEAQLDIQPDPRLPRRLRQRLHPLLSSRR